jgi:hypothetical protein
MSNGLLVKDILALYQLGIESKNEGKASRFAKTVSR